MIGEMPAAADVAEDTLRYALDGVSDAIVITDPAQIAVYANLSARDLFGHRVALGAAVGQLHAADAATQLDFRRPDGTLGVFEARQSACAWGGAPAVALVFRDITERVQLEDQLREMQKMEAIGQLTGGLAHDFNNLLGIVIGNLDLIAELAGPDAKIGKRVQTALAAALRAASVTKSLLAVARRQPMVVSRHELNACVEEMLPLLRASLGKRIDLSWVPADGEQWVAVDPTGLSTALLNLIVNARHALESNADEPRVVMSSGTVIADLGGPTAPRPAKCAVLRVADNGRGMDAEVRRRIFEPFYTTKEVGTGTGLGLPMVLGFAEQLGGTVRVDSEPDQGTTLSIFLPLAEMAPRQGASC